MAKYKAKSHNQGQAPDGASLRNKRRMKHVKKLKKKKNLRYNSYTHHGDEPYGYRNGEWIK